MILTALKSYLIKNKRAPLIDMAHHFDIEPDALKGMLEHWIRKKKVRQIEGLSCTKGCCQASQVNLEIYEWVD
ncbi:MAG: FeoC-like transcriptional regulator [Thiomargarita sp.]|nr:FeoC-like transcriptional regulator [Thiomargarita sp.]